MVGCSSGVQLAIICRILRRISRKTAGVEAVVELRIRTKML
jgi:hypothetical protein